MTNSAEMGSRLREERERLRLSQAALGEIGRVRKQAQLKYEKGDRSPDADYLSAVAAAGVDVLYVLTGMRGENVASTPTELAYLRNCRALPNAEARNRGLNMICSLREAYGIQLTRLDA